MSTENTDTQAFHIELSLVDLSQTLREDSSAEYLKGVLASIVDTLPCTSAGTFLSASGASKTSWLGFFRGNSSRSSDNEEIASRITKQVQRFVKPPDKYISLTSILLKSRAFHAIHTVQEHEKNQDNTEGTTSTGLPIVDLPRTQYKKPYIPSKTNQCICSEEDVYPFSVSHQFPFVGLGRLVINSKSEQLQNRPLVGLDIVTFDDYNRRLYDSINAFVEVFKDCFSPWEWERVNDRQNVILEEFYLRWSIKEAYTKALGVGMGLPFDSFETHLVGLEEKGIYTWLEEKVKTAEDDMDGAYIVRGTVVQKPNTAEAKSEQCMFLFLPLWESFSKQLIRSERGCACLCLVHSSLQGDEIPAFNLESRFHTLQELVDWHKEGRQSL